MSNKADLTLYGITKEIEALDQLLDMEQGEITEEYEQLETEAKAMILKKTDGCVGYLKREEDWINNAKLMISNINDVIRSKQKKIDKFKGYMTECLDMVDDQYLEGSRFSLKFRKPSKIVTITDEDKVPPKFTTVETVVKIKKAEISKALKAGEEVGGAKLEDGKRALIIGINKG